MMEYRNLLKPENIKYVPLLALGLVRGLGEMALFDLRERRTERNIQAAAITYYSTMETGEIQCPESE